MFLRKSHSKITLKDWSFRGLALLLSLMVVSTGCLPTEKQQPKDSSSTDDEDGGRGGFDGITAAQTIAATKVKVSWAASNDSSVVAYNIYDSTNMFTPRLLKTVPAPATEYTLTGLTPQTFYAFRVRATTSKNEEDGNMVDLAAIPYAGASSVAVQSSTAADILFNDGSNADEIRVYCLNTLNPIYVLMKTLTGSNVSQLSTSLTGLAPGVQYTCRVALFMGGTEDNNLQTVNFTPVGQASELVFSTQPTSAAAGVALPSQPVITIKDVNGNVVSAGPDSNAVITLSLSINSPTLGTVRGSASVSAVAGVATFTGINFQEAGVKILEASKADTSGLPNGSGVLTVESNNFTISAGNVSAARSLIAISPAVPPNAALVANGNNSYTVTITMRDQYDNPIAGIRPAFGSNIAGDTLSQPTLNTDANGQASGSISTTVADTTVARTLSVTTPTGLTSVQTLAPFVAGPPIKLGFSVQPVNSPAGPLGMTTVKVVVQDAQGNTVTTGVGATANISLSIASNLNGAVLTGTYPIDAVNGVATFSDLGISKTQTGYKLLASSGSYTPAYSNNFNVTAGTPKKIIITGASSVISGSCSAAYTLQLQDNGSNPANAIQNTPVTISGLGSAQMFSSASCAGTALGSTITFTAGTNTKTVYMKDMKAEGITVTATDSSSVLTTGTLPVKFNPNKISILAQQAPPAPPATAMTVVSGLCSTKIEITTYGENGTAGPLFSPTPVQITGMSANSELYDNPTCTGSPLDPNAVVLPASVGTNYTTNLYLKDRKAEVLSLAVIDNAGIMTTTSGLQSITVLASNLAFTGPTTVVAGLCSAAFTVGLTDALGNPVVTNNNVAVSITGLSGSVDGKFYTSSTCGGAGSNSSLTIPANGSSVTVYFKDRTAEVVNLAMSDPLGVLITSPQITMSVSPSALALSTPTPANAKTNICAGPFTINTQDGFGAICNAIGTLNVTVSGANTGGGFYSDSNCTSSLGTVQFTAGQSAKTFYFKALSLYPSGNLTFSATDAGGVLTTGTAPWSVVPAPAWLGTQGSMTNSSNALLWFRTGVTSPMSARVDGPSSATRLHFDTNKQYLYVVDSMMQRVLKYDYQNHSYVGWIGAFSAGGGIGITGSSLPTPSNAACVSTVNGATTPGWCLGGQATTGNQTLGGLYTPTDVTSASTSYGNFIYVTSLSWHMINRYNADTGAFDGYIGKLNASIPTANATGASGCTTAAANTVTPGWCKGGGVQSNASSGTGGFNYPLAITNDGTYLYVANDGYINRYHLDTGAYMGWIGWVNGTAPTADTYTAGCTTTTNARTPGWCVGGGNSMVNPRSNLGGFYTPQSLKIIGSTLYVVEPNFGGVVSMFDVNSGAYIGMLPSLSYNWVYPYQMTTDGTDFYFADRDRVIHTDNTGLINGWMGKVSNNSSMSGNSGCSTLVPNANTPGWCLGGTSKPGMDETSFNGALGIEDDGQGNLLVSQGGYGRNWWFYSPAIKIFNKATGAYGGTLNFDSTSPSNWTDVANFAQLQGIDDNGFNTPGGEYNDGTYLYVSDISNGRVKKISMATGAVVGWIGGVTTSPTGGVSGCAGANPMAAAPGWCTGALPNPNWLWNWIIPQTQNGLMHSPLGITGDGTYIYVTDYGLHRIQKFNATTGAYVGWIGSINQSPTGGAPGCLGATVGTFTPGWCTGGISQSGTGDGMLANPGQITYAAGNLYVVDLNHRVSSFNATTGAFNGWIGRINANPTSGCTYGNNGAGYNVAQSGWCKGGTAQSAPSGADKGGGFQFWNTQWMGGITNDGTYLYVGNFYQSRIDKIRISDGVTVAVVRMRGDVFSDAWITSNASMNFGYQGCGMPHNLHTDGTYLWASTYTTCGQNTYGLIKMNLSTGNTIGWKGAINPGQSPVGGETGCNGATLVTPANAWCQGGANTAGFTMGGFVQPHGVTTDANFVYVTDVGTHRITRLPK